MLQAASDPRAGKIKQAFILGAGLGTRLRPITDTVPKVMVEIAPGKPLLEHEIELLRDQGINDFVINLHYLPDVITGYFGDGKKFGVHIRYSDETDSLRETGGALKKAEPLLDEDFLFIYGDHLYFLDTRPLAHAHMANGALVTMVLKTSDAPENGDILQFDPQTKQILRSYPRPHGITSFNETLMLNAGVFAVSRKVLKDIPPDIAIKFDGEIVPRLLAEGKALYAFPTQEAILDIGTPEKYQFAKEQYSKRKRR